jgi:hypothetical protein
MIDVTNLHPSPAQQEKCVTCVFYIAENELWVQACEHQTPRQKDQQHVRNFFAKVCKGEKYQNSGELFQNIPTNVVRIQQVESEKFEVDWRKINRIAAMTVANASIIYLLVKILF